jgi:protein gp37
MGNLMYANQFEVTMHHDLIGLPLHWRKPKRIFVNSMSDLFHKDVPMQFIQRLYATMEAAHQHTFQVLTKRSLRLKELATELPWPDNVWQG